MPYQIVTLSSEFLDDGDVTDHKNIIHKRRLKAGMGHHAKVIHHKFTYMCPVLGRIMGPKKSIGIINCTMRVAVR